MRGRRTPLTQVLALTAGVAAALAACSSGGSTTPDRGASGPQTAQNPVAATPSGSGTSGGEGCTAWQNVVSGTFLIVVVLVQRVLTRARQR